MKYTILHSECSRGWGGQEIRVFSEMQAMRERGHQLLLAAPRDARIYSECEKAGFIVIPFDDAKWKYPATVLKLSKAFRQHEVQIVNMHSSRDGWLAGLAARLAQVPLIIRSRHIDVSYPNRVMSRIVYHHIPHIVLTTSNRISEGLIDALKLLPNRVSCIPTGIDLKRFEPSSATSLRNELGITTDTPLVGMVSVLRSWKGHDDFLDAAKKLLGAWPQARFIIAGDGPQKPRLEQKLRDMNLESCVQMIGHRTDVPEVLASMDVVVLPSTAHEGIPQILMQAMAMGKPVVGTQVGGIPEIVDHEENGLLVAAKNPKDLAGAIAKLLKQPSLRRAFGENGHEKAVRQFGIATMCERLEEVYSVQSLSKK